MPILSIITQPASNSLSAAYRPLVFVVQAQQTDLTPRPPVVYCDVYINGVYYKTLSKTQYSKLNPSDSEWTFDIQDAVQEYLRFDLPAYGGSLQNAPMASCRVFCRFRSSGHDANGFITTEGTAPVQATSGTAAVQGTGFESNESFVVNATLQQDEDQDLPAHLTAFKSGTWASTAYPLTHRPLKYKLCKEDNDFFGIIDTNKTCYQQLVLNYRFIGQSLWRSLTYNLPAETCTSAITAIVVNQSGSSMIITWGYSGTPESFKYRVDSGIWLSTSSTSVTLSGLSDGSHTFEVVPFCNCTDGTGNTTTFTKVNEASLCTSEVTNISGTQTAVGTIVFVVTYTGVPTSFNYRIDGGAWINVPTAPITVSGLSAGFHNIEVVPKCANGSLGVGMSGDFAVNATALYQMGTFNPANGNHTVDRSFDDGKTAMHYRIFCTVTVTWQGPFTATFAPGALTSGSVSGFGPHCFSAFTDISFTP